jgi:hypothetical protein
MTLSRRLAKLERTVADIEERERLANCICIEVQVAMVGHAHEFEAKMSRICPVHGIRRMNKLIVVGTVAPEHYPESAKEQIRKEAAALDEVIEKYYARLAAAEASPASPEYKVQEP